jgi:hypothetical protein
VRDDSTAIAAALCDHAVRGARNGAARLFLMVDDGCQACCSGRCSRLFAALLLALFRGCSAAVPERRLRRANVLKL